MGEGDTYDGRTPMATAYPPVVLAEHRPDDLRELRRALRRGRLVNPVDTCTDGQQALDRLGDPAAPAPAVLVTALDLPYVDGLALLRAVRHAPHLDGLPVVVLGGATTPDGAAVERVHALGGAYLAKPVAFGGLVQVIRGLSLPWALTSTTSGAQPARAPSWVVAGPRSA